jgi:hypothetical protein
MNDHTIPLLLLYALMAYRDTTLPLSIIWPATQLFYVILHAVLIYIQQSYKNWKTFFHTLQDCQKRFVVQLNKFHKHT